MANKKTRRVLLYRLGSLGDMLVALPALHLVARAFPNAERRLLTNIPVNTKAAAAAAVLDGSGLVQGYMRYAVGTRSVGELLRLWWTIVRWGPEVLVYLGPARGMRAARRDAAFFRMCGVQKMIGVPLMEGMQKNFYGAATGGPDHAMGDSNLEPEAARLVRCIGELGEPGDIVDPGRLGDPASWELRLSAAEHEAAAKAIGAGLASQVRKSGPPPQRASALAGDPGPGAPSDLIAVSVGTKVQAKDWGKENWRALLAQVAKEFPGRVLLLAGVAEESEASEFAAEGWRTNGGGPVVNLCGRLTPRESAAAFARARIFVGHDSGPMHLAAVVGTPVVGIFSARNIPRQWFPFGKKHRVVYHRVECWGCGLETCIEQQKKCLMSITVDEVMVEVRAALAEVCLQD